MDLAHSPPMALSTAQHTFRRLLRRSMAWEGKIDYSGRPEDGPEVRESTAGMRFRVRPAVYARECQQS